MFIMQLIIVFECLLFQNIISLLKLNIELLILFYRGNRGGYGGDRRRDNYRDGGGSGPDRRDHYGNRSRPY